MVCTILSVDPLLLIAKGARCSSVVEVLIMVRWVIGSILHGAPTELFSFQPVLYDWYNK